jgi:gamma-glutamylputrescine oxidase
MDHTAASKYHIIGDSSYWQKTVTPTPLSSDLPSLVDVAIVGGGILGASLSYWLARAGANAAILERTALAYGATGRNGGFVSIGTAESYPTAIARLGHETARAVLKVTLENQALLRHVLNEEQIPCDYHEPGTLSLALTEDHLIKLKQDIATLQADGVTASLLDRKQVQELVGTPLGPEILGGKFMPGQGVIHPIRLVQGLVETAWHRGARAYAATVLQLSPDGEGMLVQTAQGSLHAGTVIVAVNAWIGEILPSLARLITPVRGQVLTFAPISPVFTVGMSSPITYSGEYWQQRSDGSIVLGGCRAAAPGWDVGVRQNQPTAEVQMALEQVFPRLFPALGGLQVAQRWAGLMAFTPDYLPIVDRVPSLPSVWVVGGFSGHGMPFGIRLGQLLAEAFTSGTWPTALLPFRFDRPTLKSFDRATTE